MLPKTFPGQRLIRGRTLPIWQGGLIVLAVFLAYLPAVRGAFVWDDDSWTTNLSTLFQNTSGLYSIWFQPTALQQYYPLTGTTFWLDYQFWEFWTLPYHVENILLHAVAALLFWRLLLRLQLPGAWLAAAIFALHPVMVESVAWITERKNVLSLVLYLGAFLAYLRYAQGVASDREQAERRILPCLVSRVTRHSFMVWLLSCSWGRSWPKPPPFPCQRLFCCWLGGNADISGGGRTYCQPCPSLPCPSGLCAVTAWLEKNHVGAQGPDFALTFPNAA